MPDPSIIVATVGVAAGIVAFITALINSRAAWFGWRKAVETPEMANRAPEPKVLLPARSYFIGRDAEMREAVVRLSAGEIVLSIEGELGIGKSAAAAELAHRLRTFDSADGGMLDLREHTFVWIDGRNGCPSLVEICRLLSLLTGDQSLSTVADDEKLDALRAHLANHKTVLLLDNLRPGEDAWSHRLHEFLETVPTGSLVIASVNRPGALAASRVLLKDLDMPQVLELIHHEVDRLGLGETGKFDEVFARRLHQVVGGNPRLIEWFLRVLPRSSRSLDEHLAAVERGEGLPALFAPVWDELNETSRRVLGACAYLRGQAIADQLRIACNLNGADLSVVLDELLSCGLVAMLRVSGRPNLYTCAHGFQRFVLGETSDDTMAAFTERLAAHYINYFGSNWEDARGAIPHIGAIQVVLEELYAQGNDPDLQALFRATLDILFTLGLFDDRISSGALAYESAVRAANNRSASLASAVLSSTYAIRGQLVQAREALALGFLAAESSGAPGEIARQMRCSGFLKYRWAQPEQALAAIEGADEMARTAGDLNNLVDILGLRTAALWYLRRLGESEAVAKACLKVCEEIPWERAMAYPLRDLAETAINRRDFRHAHELLGRARAIAAEYQDQRQLARVNLTEARMNLVKRQFRAAKRIASAAESEAIRLGLPPEAREAGAVRVAAGRARLLPPVGLYYVWHPATRLTEAPVGGD